MSAQSLSVIRLDGELEMSRRDEIAKALQLQGNERGVLLDFCDVTYADSTTLAELLRFRSDANRCHVPVAIVICCKQFARLIEYAGLGKMFPIFRDRGAALTHLAQQENDA